MANAYVSSTGSAAYPGTVSAPTSLGTALSTAVAGDVVYLAPGVYRGTFTLTVSGTSGNVITFIGDTTNSLAWTGASAGEVRITNYASDTANPTAVTNGTLEATSRNYVTFQNLVFECYGSSFRSGGVYLSSCTYFTFTSCAFKSVNAAGVRINTSAASNITLNRCSAICTDAAYNYLVFVQATTGSNYNSAITLNSCIAIRAGLLWFDAGGNQSNTTGGGYTVINGTSIGNEYGVRSFSTNTTHQSVITNCFIIGTTGSMYNVSTGVVVQTYNVYFGGITNIATSATSSAVGVIPINVGEVNMQAYGSLPIMAPYITSRLRAFGTASGAPATDIYNNAWSGITPDAGGLTYVQQGNSAYLPSERNASTITIAPGSTSQSIELYLGVTGLTASAIGLSARYNRTRTADQPITLVARTIADPWVSGGFAEVNASTMPGVYRLDIPNEALASGVDDVTIVVRGASGTNGAVMSIKLSSGGLTSTQTAQAVWNALTSSHTTHGTFGWNSLRADAPSKEGLVTLHQSGGTSRVDADVHAIKNDTDAATYLKGALLHDGTGYVDADVVRISTSTAAANELEGALLHNGTDYIDSNLIGGNSTRVFVGRFDLRQTGSDDVDTIEVFTTDTPSFELQLTDGDGNEVPVTGATLGLRILDVASTVVETGTPTVEYGTGGIVRWTGPGTYLAIGCPAGMYRLFIDRTVSGTTTTFGPLQIKVQAQ
jgi:hypothetical protein